MATTNIPVYVDEIEKWCNTDSDCSTQNAQQPTALTLVPVSDTVTIAQSEHGTVACETIETIACVNIPNIEESKQSPETIAVDHHNADTSHKTVQHGAPQKRFNAKRRILGQSGKVSSRHGNRSTDKEQILRIIRDAERAQGITNSNAISRRSRTPRRLWRQSGRVSPKRPNRSDEMDQIRRSVRDAERAQGVRRSKSTSRLSRSPRRVFGQAGRVSFVEPNRSNDMDQIRRIVRDAERAQGASESKSTSRKSRSPHKLLGQAGRVAPRRPNHSNDMEQIRRIVRDAERAQGASRSKSASRKSRSPHKLLGQAGRVSSNIGDTKDSSESNNSKQVSVPLIGKYVAKLWSSNNVRLVLHLAAYATVDGLHDKVQQLQKKQMKLTAGLRDKDVNAFLRQETFVKLPGFINARKIRRVLEDMQKDTTADESKRAEVQQLIEDWRNVQIGVHAYNNTPRSQA